MRSRTDDLRRIDLKFSYYKDTDSLYIDLTDKPGSDSQEVAPGIVLDFDEDGKLVGIDIQDASENVELSSLITDEVPLRKMSIK